MPQICAAAVSFKLVQALSKQKNFDPEKYLQFVALATVCDVMPLVDENRIFVKLGLKMLEKTKNTGMKNLIQASDLDGRKLNSYHLGFVLGPRINAAGRMGDALDVVRLFAAQNKQNAHRLAAHLSKLNLERRGVTEQMYEQALEQAISQDTDNKLIFVTEQDWHEGIIGLVAGKLSEKFHKPVICGTIINDVVTASARSIDSYNITEAISIHSEALIRFGGHSQAAGMSFRQEKLASLKKAMQEIANKAISGKDVDKIIKVDSEMHHDDLNLDLLEWLEKFEPFGFANPKPIFLFRDTQVVNFWKLGQEKEHIKFKLLLPNSQAIEAIVFHAGDNFEGISIGDTIDLIGQLDINEWKGHKRIQIKIEDFKIV
jgi:single-stranded-DNA-specific exonuclease